MIVQPTKEQLLRSSPKSLQESVLSIAESNPHAAKQRIVDAIQKHLSPLYTSLWSYNQATKTLHLGATSAARGSMPDAILPPNSPVADAFAEDTPYGFIPDVQNDSRYSQRDLVKAYGLKRMYSFAIQRPNHLPEGALCVYPDRDLTEDEISLLVSVAGMAAVPILLSLDRLTFSIVETINALPPVKRDPGSLLHKVIDVVRGQISMEGMSAFIWDSANEVFVLSKSSDRELAANWRDVRYHPDDPFYSELLEGKTIVRHGDDALELFEDTRHREKDVRDYYTVILVPIVNKLGGGRVLGLLRFANELNRVRSAAKDYFSHNDREIFERCAAAVSVALHHHQETERVKETFANFLHEAAAQIEGIEAKCERLLHPERFGEPDPDVERHVRDIERYKEVLMEALLQYTSIGIDEYEIHPQTTPAEFLGDVIVPCINAAIPDIRKRRLPTKISSDKYSIHYSADEFRPVRRLVADTGRLRQVFSNLLKNAIKYHADDPLQFEINILVRDLSESEFGIVVCDTGIGIKEARRQRIFEKGYRTPEALRRDTYGTGYGLFLVREFMEKHGGGVELLGKTRWPELKVAERFNTAFLLRFPKSVLRV